MYTGRDIEGHARKRAKVGQRGSAMVRNHVYERKRSTSGEDDTPRPALEVLARAC